jgi:hypothetical protein
MKRLITTLLICVVSFTGCLTLSSGNKGAPSNTSILIEGGLIGIAFYQTKDDDFPDNSERAIMALEKANGFIQAMYGDNYTISGLAHSLLESQISVIDNPQLRKYIYIARIMIDKDGELTGIPLLDAILIADELNE